MVTSFLAGLVEFNRVRNFGRVLALNDAEIAHEADESPGGEGSARKPEDEDLITRFVVEDQEGVGARDLVDQSFTEEAPLPVVVFAGPDA